MSALRSGKYTVVAACESDKKKADFICKVVHKKNCPCIFKDVAACGGEKAACWTHDDVAGCKVPHAKTGMGGWSCKGISAANTKKQRESTAR